MFAILGVGHASLMLFSTKFEPLDPGLLAQLKRSQAGLSKTGNLWNGIQGFHLSHSLGLVVFGVFYTTLALENPGYLQPSTTLNLGLVLVPALYIYLAHRYWFSVPRNCFVVTFGLLLLSLVCR
ncbi:MAG: hypothetical protein H7172_13680 [Ferruginibacter sp.]|nr:hypothetical protein [Rhodoferax sp.]